MLGLFLDTETSGLDPFLHVPLELGMVIVDLSTGTEVAAYETLLRVSDDEWRARDLNSVAINGLTRECLEKGISRKEAAKTIEAFLTTYGVTKGEAFFYLSKSLF